MYEFESTMRNNLIFYGIGQEERETPERLLSKVKIYIFIYFYLLLSTYLPTDTCPGEGCDEAAPEGGTGRGCLLRQQDLLRARGAGLQTRARDSDTLQIQQYNMDKALKLRNVKLGNLSQLQSISTAQNNVVVCRYFN